MTVRKITNIVPLSQWIILAIVFSLYFTVGHATRLPRVSQERCLPPAEFDHEYDGELFLTRMKAAEIGLICAHALSPGQKLALGCSQRHGDKKCIVMIAKDEDLKNYGLDYDIIHRHEIGHCNGWLH